MSVLAPRRRKRLWPRLVVALVILLGLLVAADRIAVVVAQSAVAKTVRDSQHLAHRPDVDITGFPFLTQLAAGHFGKIILSDDDVVVGDSGRSVRLERLKVTLHDVRVERSFSSGTAGTVTAAALLGYDDLSATLGVTVTYAGSGRVRAAASTTISGNEIHGEVTALPRLRGQSLQFGSPTVTVNGAQAPGAVSSALAGAFGAPIALGNLPYHLSVQRLDAEADGLHVTLRAQNLTLRR